MRLLPKQNSATQRSLEIDRPLILESPDQLKSARRRKLASRRDKRVWEGLKHQRPVTSVSYASTFGSCFLFIKTVKDWTFGQWRASITRFCQLLQRLLHRLKTAYFGIYIGNLGFGSRENCCAGGVA